jgi:hypothetical protein
MAVYIMCICFFRLRREPARIDTDKFFFHVRDVKLAEANENHLTPRACV